MEGFENMKNIIKTSKVQLENLKKTLKGTIWESKDIFKMVDDYNDITNKLESLFKGNFGNLIIKATTIKNNSVKTSDKLENELKNNIDRCIAILTDLSNSDDKDKKIAELTDMLQRLQAEFENYQKRCDKNNSEFREYVKSETIGKLLPILDSFELALKNSKNVEEFKKGVELIFGQLYDMMEKEGMMQIKTEGEKFDPYKHEVLMTEKTDKDGDDDKIVEELQKGYMFKDKVLRYAKVKVLKKSEGK